MSHDRVMQDLTRRPRMEDAEPAGARSSYRSLKPWNCRMLQVMIPAQGNGQQCTGPLQDSQPPFAYDFWTVA